MAPKRVNIGIALIIGMVLISLGYNLFILDPPGQLERIRRSGSLINLSITQFESKFDCLRSEIDPGEAYGFLTTPGERTTYLERYILTKFTLAPAVIIDSGSPSYFIGYFPEPGDFQKALENNPGLTVLTQCDEEAALLRNTP